LDDYSTGRPNCDDGQQLRVPISLSPLASMQKQLASTSSHLLINIVFTAVIVSIFNFLYEQPLKAVLYGKKRSHKILTCNHFLFKLSVNSCAVNIDSSEVFRDHSVTAPLPLSDLVAQPISSEYRPWKFRYCITESGTFFRCV